jgi:hypothetical protein
MGHGSQWVKLRETKHLQRLIFPLPELYAFIKAVHGNGLSPFKQWSMLIIRAHLMSLQQNAKHLQMQTDHEDYCLLEHDDT